MEARGETRTNNVAIDQGHDSRTSCISNFFKYLASKVQRNEGLYSIYTMMYRERCFMKIFINKIVDLKLTFWVDFGTKWTQVARTLIPIPISSAFSVYQANKNFFYRILSLRSYQFDKTRRNLSESAWHTENNKVWGNDSSSIRHLTEVVAEKVMKICLKLILCYHVDWKKMSIKRI